MLDITENEGGGTTICLTEGDSLDDVPASHQKLITNPIREAFTDPHGYFSGLADFAPVPAMKKWLMALLEDNCWDLNLHQGDPKEWTSAGFCWWSDTVHSAEMAPPNKQRPQLPVPILNDYFSVLDYVRWMPFGCAGGLDGCGNHTPLTEYSYQYHGAEIDPQNTFIWGWSPCGDMMIYTTDDRGGWTSHENGRIHLLGTTADLLEWVYSKLLAKTCPEMDF